MKTTFHQRFEPYWKWEDYEAGMYRDVHALAKSNYISLSSTLLCNPIELLAAMESVCVDWPIATAVNFTNLSQNRRAWLGQAACCWRWKSPEALTRAAWCRISETAQRAANDVAERVIANWEQTTGLEYATCQSNQLALTF